MKGEAGKAKQGLSVGMAGFFLVAQMAGAGFLALPRAIADTGWLGIPMMIIFCVSVGFAGTRLGKSWIMLEERWPQDYKEPARQPYMEIAYRALGSTGRKVTMWTVVINLYGSTIVHMILMSQMLARLVQEGTDECILTKCQFILIVGCFLIPLTWLGTPKDFWQASIMAVVATVIAVVVVVVELFLLEDHLPSHPVYPNPSVTSFALGFGAILFAFGGAAVFPTIQNDMADRSKFWISVLIGFTGILSLYLPTGVVGYVKIGDQVESNILLSVPTTVAVGVAIIMEIINLLGTFIISSNPVYQSLEELFHVPNRFCWQRCVLRTSLVGLQMVIGLSVPDFGKILNLVGGSLITLCTFIFPPLFYMKLCDASDQFKHLPPRIIPTWERIFLIEIMIVGIIGGVLATSTAFYDIIASSLSGSCFSTFSEC